VRAFRCQSEQRITKECDVDHKHLVLVWLSIRSMVKVLFSMHYLLQKPMSLNNLLMVDQDVINWQSWATQQKKRINSIQFVERRFQLNSIQFTHFWKKFQFNSTEFIDVIKCLTIQFNSIHRSFQLNSTQFIDLSNSIQLNL
jgi:hypothetical protein